MMMIHSGDPNDNNYNDNDDDNDDADDNEDAMIGKNKKSNINNCIRSDSYYCGDDIYDDTKL